MSNMRTTITHHRIIDTFLGPFALISDATGELLSSTWVDIQNDATDFAPQSQAEANLLPRLVSQLEQYFAGEAVEFDDVATPPGSPFFERCWQACRLIPRGETCSYAELAASAGTSTGAARAAGQAMRRNPLAVIIPCHRVVGSDGQLHGYSSSQDPAGPHLAIKRALLHMEGALSDGEARPRTSLVTVCA